MRLVHKLAFLWLGLGVMAYASSSTVTATITDSDSVVWANLTYNITLLSPLGPPTVNGVPLTPSQQQFSGQANGSGTFTVTLTDTSSISPAGAQWCFSLMPNASAVAPSVICTAVVGATPNLSTTLSAGVLAPRFKTGTNSFGYSNLEVLQPIFLGQVYWNVTQNCYYQYSLTGWQTCPTGGGGGAVSSVSNSDGTLTISPTTGAVVGSLALGHANTWTGLQTGPFSYTTLVPAAVSNINFVGTGDSRMAGSAVPGGQDYLTYLATQPQFASRATFYNEGVSGATCSTMTSAYVGSVQPHKPSGGITVAYLSIEEGINDLTAGTSAATLETCWAAYIAQAVSDGFTPVLNTVYYSSVLTAAQDSQRILFNDWVRSNFGSDLVIDVDWLFPSTSTATNPFMIDSLHLNGKGNLIWAQGTNQLWGLAKSGTNLFTNLDHDFINPISTNYNINASVEAGLPQGGLPVGSIMSGESATTGLFWLGTDTNDYISRSSVNSTLFHTNGTLQVELGDSGGADYFQILNSGSGTVAQISSQGLLFTNDLLGLLTIPTGSCPVSGAWQLTQDGGITACQSGTWGGGTITSPQPIAINSTQASQASMTYNSTAPTVGSGTTAVYAVNSSGQAVVSEAGGAFARVCDATNSVCGGGVSGSGTIGHIPIWTGSTTALGNSNIDEVTNTGFETVNSQGFIITSPATASNQAFIFETAAGLPTSGQLGMGFGQAASSNNMAFLNFNYTSSGSTSNSFCVNFYAGTCVETQFATGDVGIGVGTTDPGVALGVTGTMKSTTLETSVMTQIAANNWGGSCTMSTTTCTLTIGHTYTTPICIATIQGATATASLTAACGVSGNTVTVTASASNALRWGILVFGNPN